MKPKISIIVTSYNVEKYIGTCIENIIDQTIKEIEIIVVDDGSNDKTCEIIQSYAQKDPRIVPIFLKENSIGGVATPANVGIDAATGDYIGFADGDDLYEPTMFEKLYKSATENDSDIAICSYMNFEDDTGTKIQPHDPFWNDLVSQHTLDISSPEHKRKIIKLISVPWRKLYKRSLLIDQNLRFPVSDHFFEDNGFHWITTLNANKISFVDEILCYHRRNRDGQTTASNGKRMLGVFHQHTVIYDYLSNNKLLDTYRKNSLGWLMGHFSWIRQVVGSQHYDAFYELMIAHFSRYKADEVQTFMLNQYFERKDIELVISILRKNRKLFIATMDGRISTTTKEKIMFNYYRLGATKFASMAYHQLKYRVNMKIKKK